MVPKQEINLPARRSDVNARSVIRPARSVEGLAKHFRPRGTTFLRCGYANRFVQLSRVSVRRVKALAAGALTRLAYFQN